MLSVRCRQGPQGAFLGVSGALYYVGCLRSHLKSYFGHCCCRFSAQPQLAHVIWRGNRNPEINFHGKRLRWPSCRSLEARLNGQGKEKESGISFMGHALMQNRNRLVADTHSSLPPGTTEKAVLSLRRQRHRAVPRDYGCREDRSAP